MKISTVKLAYRLRETLNEILNILLSLALKPQLFLQQTHFLSLCFPGFCSICFPPFLQPIICLLLQLQLTILLLSPLIYCFSVLLTSSNSNLTLFPLKLLFHTARFSSSFHFSLTHCLHLYVLFFHSAQIVAWSGLFMSPFASLSLSFSQTVANPIKCLQPP